MQPEVARGLRVVLSQQALAALGTLHEGEPYVSMVPFAVLGDGPDFVIHVSRLAAHTRDMLEHPSVSLLVIAPPEPGVAPQATARVTIQGEARPCAAAHAGHAEARQAYLERFPESAPMFELGDFSLFAIRPRMVRFVGGFAQAKTVTPEGLAAAIRGADLS